MKRAVLAGLVASGSVLAGCAGLPWEGKARHVALEDNIGGKSAPRIESTDAAVEVQVAQVADSCRLDHFLVGPSASSHGGGGASAAGEIGVRAPDGVQGSRAILNVYRPGDWTVRAEYVHSVMVDEGHGSEPDGQAQAWGAGDLQVGRALGGGYRFDRLEFSSRATGPGGASARVSRYPTLHSHDATATIHWYYDEFSHVAFQWKIYALGPCDATP